MNGEKEKVEVEKVVIMLAGVNGCGKGTVVKKIPKTLKVERFTMSDYLSKDSDAKKSMVMGNLVDDEIVNRVFSENFRRALFNNRSETIILDGFPRNKEQLSFFNENFNCKNKLVKIHLNMFNKAFKGFKEGMDVWDCFSTELKNRLTGRFIFDGKTYNIHSPKLFCGALKKHYENCLKSSNFEESFFADPRVSVREDDKDGSVIKNRLQFFLKQTYPMILNGGFINVNCHNVSERSKLILGILETKKELCSA